MTEVNVFKRAAEEIGFASFPRPNRVIVGTIRDGFYIQNFEHFLMIGTGHPNFSSVLGISQ